MVLEIHFSVPSLEISMGIKDTDTWKFSGALKISRTWKNPGPLEISRAPGNFKVSWKFPGGSLISHRTSSVGPAVLYATVKIVNIALLKGWVEQKSVRIVKKLVVWT